MKRERFMTAVEFAKAIDYDYSTVMRWLHQGIVPGAEFMPVSESGKFGIWRIPQAALEMEKPRLGRKRQSRKAAKAGKKQAKK
jgi:hypothetical protein